MIDLSAIEVAVSKAVGAVVNDLAEECTRQIEDEKWEWPRETRRQNGQTVGSPRDIVDRGDLRSSQVTSVDNLTGAIAYTADHAVPVHYGSISQGGLQKPARPWMEEAIAEVDSVQVFANELRRQLS